ncbi:hypothetical protein [Frankia sp. QA3]|uniref:glycine-rich domain-containing protein n=1 Tax=Frankia sp. QA3 TaxID=710111 RepID=UPI000269C814|nr:hypothetical protein [Frankia sp. QA3]EIV94550.1 hypothetical protein FraQA3DRAFT_4307 [Frankia sp. QA3]
MPATLAPPRLGRDLIPQKLYKRLVARLEVDHPEVADDAGRIVDQALAFLAACGPALDRGLRPSRAVDLGWHTFLLFTKDYSLFCRKVAGTYIHHVPDDKPASAGKCAPEPDGCHAGGDPAGHPGSGGIARTVRAIERLGYQIEPDLWASAADCADEGNCSASGKDGDENQGSRIPK